MKQKCGINFQIIIEYLFVITIILNCNSVYAAAETEYHFNEIAAFLSVLLVIISISKNGLRNKLMNRWFVLFTIYYLLMFIFAIVSVPSESLLGFVSRFIVFVPLMSIYLSIIAKDGNQNRLLFAFTNVIVFLSILSIFFWFWGSFLAFINPNMSVRAHWGGGYTYPGYFGLYFERQTISLFLYSGFRNSSIFTEGPMYSFCLIIAIATLLFLDNSAQGKFKTRTKIKLIILSVTLITVMSFAGYALYAGMLFLRFIISNNRTKSSVRFRLIVSTLIFICGSFAVLILFLEKQQTSSWLIRIDDIQAGIKAWLASPIFGNGYGSYVVEQYMSSFRWWNTGYSSALLSVLSQGGMVFFSVYFFAFFFGFRSVIRTKDKSLAVFVGVVLIEFIISLVHFTFLLLFLLAYCYMLNIASYVYKIGNRQNILRGKCTNHRILNSINAQQQTYD